MKLYETAVPILRKIISLFFKVELRNWDTIPEEEGLIICANHWSNWDPLFITAYFPYKIHWMAKKELFKIPVLSFFLKKVGVFSIDRSKSPLSALKTTLKLLKEKENIGIFPEGTRVSEINFKNAKSGVGLIAFKTKATVIPIYIESSYKLFKPVTLTVRPSMKPYEELDTNKDYGTISEEIMKSIYGVGEKD